MQLFFLVIAFFRLRHRGAVRRCQRCTGVCNRRLSSLIIRHIFVCVSYHRIIHEALDRGQFKAGFDVILCRTHGIQRILVMRIGIGSSIIDLRLEIIRNRHLILIRMLPQNDRLDQILLRRLLQVITVRLLLGRRGSHLVDIIPDIADRTHAVARQKACCLRHLIIQIKRSRSEIDLLIIDHHSRRRAIHTAASCQHGPCQAHRKQSGSKCLISVFHEKIPPLPYSICGCFHYRSEQRITQYYMFITHIYLTRDIPASDLKNRPLHRL